MGLEFEGRKKRGLFYHHFSDSGFVSPLLSTSVHSGLEKQFPESFTCTRSVQKLEEFDFVKLDLDVVSCELRLWNMSLFELAEVHVSCVLRVSAQTVTWGGSGTSVTFCHLYVPGESFLSSHSS